PCRRDRPAGHLPCAGSPPVRELERRARLRRHRDDPAAADPPAGAGPFRRGDGGAARRRGGCDAAAPRAGAMARRRGGRFRDGVDRLAAPRRRRQQRGARRGRAPPRRFRRGAAATGAGRGAHRAGPRRPVPARRGPVQKRLAEELPRPLTRQSWGNAALLAPATARRLGLDTGDVVEISVAGARAAVPAMLLPGQAEDCVTLALGYGRRAIGIVGAGIGSDVNPLRRAAAPWQLDGVALRPAGRRELPVTAQQHQTMAGRDIVRVAALGESPPPAPPPGERPSLYPPHRYDGNAWGMAISLASCIGCGACTAACQAENNIPVVGREEVARGRAMHWIRVDRY